VRSAPLAAAVCALVLLVGACEDDGGGESGSTTDAANDATDGDDRSTGGVPSDDGNQTACDIFTRKDAGELLGGPGVRSIDLDEARASTCEYILEGDNTVFVGVSVGTFDDADAAESVFVAARANARFDELEPVDVDGVGDEAYWIDASTNFTREINGEPLTIGELDARGGATIVTVYVSPADQATAERAAQLVLP